MRLGSCSGRAFAISAFSCRRSNFSKLVPNDAKRQALQEHKRGHIDRFAAPSHPNELLVETRKLTRGESAYQYFAAGFPWIILITFTSFPAAIATYWYLSRDRWKENKSASILPQGDTDATAAFKITLPTEIAAKDLQGLLSTNEPTVIVYFNTNKHDKMLLHKLVLLLLSEISNLPGCPLKVKRLNVTQQLQNLPVELKKELESNNDSMYLQLVIPNKTEALVAKLDAPVSVESFNKQIKGLLQHFNLHKYKPHPKDVKRLDDKLQQVKQCLFQLEVDGNMDSQYQKLVSINNFDALVQACASATSANTASVIKASGKE